MDTMEKILRESQVLELVGLSKSTLWRLEQLGAFPRRRRLGSRSVGWLMSEVMEWIASRPQTTDREAGEASPEKENGLNLEAGRIDPEARRGAPGPCALPGP